MPAHTEKDIDQMCARVFEICGSVHNRHLAALLQAYLDDEQLMNNFCRAPAAMNFHHAFVGGLLEHTLNAMEVADAVCKFYPTLNRDVVVAGIFLHDLAKTWELAYENAFSYTDGGQLVGHIVKGAIWVEQKAEAAEKILGEKIPRQLIDVIQHIILSHHGEPEFSAARVPSRRPEGHRRSRHRKSRREAGWMQRSHFTRGDSAGESNWTDWQKKHSTAASIAPTSPPPPKRDRARNRQRRRIHRQPHRRHLSNPCRRAPAGPVKINNPLFESTPARKR